MQQGAGKPRCWWVSWKGRSHTPSAKHPWLPPGSQVSLLFPGAADGSRVTQHSHNSAVAKTCLPPSGADFAVGLRVWWPSHKVLALGAQPHPDCGRLAMAGCGKEIKTDKDGRNLPAQVHPSARAK